MPGTKSFELHPPNARLAAAGHLPDNDRAGESATPHSTKRQILTLRTSYDDALRRSPPTAALDSKEFKAEQNKPNIGELNWNACIPSPGDPRGTHPLLPHPTALSLVRTGPRDSQTQAFAPFLTLARRPAVELRFGPITGGTAPTPWTMTWPRVVEPYQ